MTAPAATVAARSTRYTATASAAVRAALADVCATFVSGIVDGDEIEVSLSGMELRLRVRTAPVAAKAKDGHP